MKKIILIGSCESGKTTLKHALNQETTTGKKTSYVDYQEKIIDTPGEYIEHKMLAVALYSYETDMVGLLLSATEAFSPYNPNITTMVNREVIGIVTKIDDKRAEPEKAKAWLELAGCKRIFLVSAKTGEGMKALEEYLGI